MRTRKEIWDNLENASMKGVSNFAPLEIEVLLDIRDLLEGGVNVKKKSNAGGLPPYQP